MAFLDGYDDNQKNALSDVFYQHVFPQCKFNEILRFRRVGSVAKDLLVQDYLGGHPELVPALEINETDERNVNKFLAMKIPVTKVYLNNEVSQREFYDKWKSGLEEFLELYGNQITHLRVHTLRVCMDDEEVKFFKRFTKLECLSARNLVYYETVNSTQAGCDLNVTTFQTNVFKNLKSIDFGFEDVFKRPFLTRTVIGHAPVFMPNCHLTMESVTLPFSPFHHGMEKRMRDAIALHPAPNDTTPELMTLPWSMRDIVAFLSGDLHNQVAPPKIKRFSFEHFYYLDQTSSFSKRLEIQAGLAFIALATKCVELGVNLEKVNSAWTNKAYMKPRGDYGKAVVSMVNIHPCAISVVRMDNLEELVVNTSRSSVSVFTTDGAFPLTNACRLGTRPEWRKLKILKINQDSSHLSREAVLYPFLGATAAYLPYTPVKCMFEFLFDKDAPPFQELTELSLEFNEIPGVNVISNRIVNDIVRCCGTVRKLELTNWTGMNKGVIKLFGGMESLEEVVIRNCKNLGNVAFVGEDAANPVFLRLTKMKKLSLLGLDNMPKVTDLLFRLVISQMTLSHLVLSSEAPITTVTQEGVRSLLKGPFADSIVKFPFERWSLQNCSSDEFRNLSREFRSSNML